MRFCTEAVRVSKKAKRPKRQTPRRWGLGNPAEETFCRLDQITKPSSNNTRPLGSILNICKIMSILKFTKSSGIARSDEPGQGCELWREIGQSEAEGEGPV